MMSINQDQGSDDDRFHSAGVYKKEGARSILGSSISSAPRRSQSQGSTKKRRTNLVRSGVTAVEFALTAPILFLLVFGSIEFSRANMLVHTAAIAATEGARRSIVAGATAAECQAAAMSELNVLGIRTATVVVTPSVIDADTPQVSVRVDVPMDGNNAYVMPRFFIGKTVSKTITLQREGS